MKFNQFGRNTKTSFQEKIAELTNINYLDNTVLKSNDLNFIWLSFLNKSFPECKSVNGKKEQLENILATDTLSILKYTLVDTVESTSFYNVALQLLGFTVGEDFDIDDPFSSMDRLNLPYKRNITSVADLINAWYNFLCTYTKNGQTFIDYLASKGFFLPLYNLPSDKKPLFFNGKSLPIFDTSTLIYETVYVESDIDSDFDGQRDLLKVNIIRPKQAHFHSPVIYTASPYNQGTNDKAAHKIMHNVDVSLKRKEPTQLKYSDIAYKKKNHSPLPTRPIKGKTNKATESFSKEPSYTLNDYLLARGFAVVYAAGVGTKDSQGFRTCGSPTETQSTISVIKWLTGKAIAFTNKTDNIKIDASSWCNGKIAMTGKSYLGTLATAAATSGISGLETVISEAAISSWYDYYRDGGLVVAPLGFLGEDADVLAEECFSRQQNAADYANIKTSFNHQLAKIKNEQDRNFGNYNRFWDARNYLKDVNNIKCDMILVHGLNDWNVKLRNVYNLFEKIQKLPISKKLILHQGQHIYINNFQSLDFSDMMNLWLSHKLFGIENDAKNILPDILVQDNTLESTWHIFKDWNSSTDSSFNLNLIDDELTFNTPLEGIKASFNNQISQTNFDVYRKNLKKWFTSLLTSSEQNKLIYKTEKISTDYYLKGAPKINLRVSSSKNYGMLSFMLVDFGKAKRLKENPTILSYKSLDAGFRFKENNLVEFKFDQTSDYKLITRGHINLQNRTSLYKTDELIANQFVDLTVTLQPMFYRLKKGHRLGLIIYSTDMEMTIRNNENITYCLDLDSCSLTFLAKKLGAD